MGGYGRAGLAPRQGPCPWPRAIALELTAAPAAVAFGRREVRRALRDWDLDYLADDAELAVSESLANAIRAAGLAGGARVALRLLAGRERLLIEVWDASPADPEFRSPDDEAETGRGLAVIDAVSDRWGFRRADPGLKVVWCELLTKGFS